MAKPLKRHGPNGQLPLLLPIEGRPAARVQIKARAKGEIEESRRRLMKDLEGTGLRRTT